MNTCSNFNTFCLHSLSTALLSSVRYGDYLLNKSKTQIKTKLAMLHPPFVAGRRGREAADVVLGSTNRRGHCRDSSGHLCVVLSGMQQHNRLTEINARYRYKTVIQEAQKSQELKKWLPSQVVIPKWQQRNRQHSLDLQERLQTYPRHTCRTTTATTTPKPPQRPSNR
jgi:hypothetical protein